MTTGDKPVPRRTLDAIFVHVIKPDDALKARLRDAGFDVDRPEPCYSVVTHKACLDIARQHLYPNAPAEEGFRRLGREWIGGFAKNPVGVVLAAGARLLGPERALARIPGYMKAGRTDYDLEIRSIKPRHWVLTATDRYRPMPHLTAGCVEAILELAGVRDHHVTVERTDAGGFALQIEWS